MLFLSIVSLILCTMAWLHYLWLIPQERVPVRPIGHAVAMGAALVGSAAALVVAQPWWVALAIAVFGTWPLAGLFLWLLTQARLPAVAITQAVGEALRPFEAQNSAGGTWSSDSVLGHRTLFKFYRGDW